MDIKPQFINLVIELKRGVKSLKESNESSQGEDHYHSG